MTNLTPIQKIVALDVDDVILDLVPYWVSLYNRDYDDGLKVDDITDWEITRFVKCGHAIFNYLVPSIYEHLPVVQDALKGVLYLRGKGYRVIFVTANGGKTAGVKFDVLNRHGFEVAERDYVEARDKSLITCHYLVDDNHDNVITAFGVGILYSRPWNRKFNYFPRVNSWDDLIRIL